ncbi:MAG: FG-GAP repeat protein, partial [Phycisphaerales bacterium]|nr:FG-GAP repeat protein [Phycisphaerales bacterium]
MIMIQWRIVRATFSILVLVALTAHSYGQVGTVLRHVQIGSGQGGFSGALTLQDRFGGGLAGIGDIDGDGIPDAAIGAPLDDDGVTDSGAVWILFLRADGTVRTQQKISNLAGGLAANTVSSGDRFGNAITGIGDLNGDGVPDIAVGAVLDATGGMTSGAVYLLCLDGGGNVVSQVKLDSTTPALGAIAPGDLFGGDVANLGDIDGNGVDDLAVGAYLDTPVTGGLTQPGAV